MKIEQIEPSCGLLVQLMPDDCCHLADACRLAASEASEGTGPGTGDPHRAFVYDALAAALEGYALAGAAPGFMRATGEPHYTPERVRGAWLHETPGGGAR